MATPVRSWLSGKPSTESGSTAVHDDGPVGSDQRFLLLKSKLHQQLIAEMDLSTIGTLSEEQLRVEVRRAAEELCRLSSALLSLSDRERLVNEVLDETFGLGPLEALMRDPTITDILVNGPKTVYVERNGQLERASIAFNDDRHLIQIVQRIVGRVGRRVDETKPMVDARLPDGSRINAIIPPLALDGSLVSIRRFGARPLLISDLINKKAVTPDMIKFLAACVEARLNVLISGGTGSGKTTLLNALSMYIPPDERIVTIEDAAELRLQQPHVGRMETRPANVEGTGEVTTRDLVRNALRMRPDRIIIGECRGPEALDMLQAMNTGHDGSMTTIHANDTRDAISRLEMMVGMAGFDLPIWIIRRQISAALQIVVQVARLTGGARKIIKISEITGMEGDVITMHDLFCFKQTGLGPDRKAQGHFLATGMRPHCLEQLTESGIRLPVEMFERRTLAS
ncbi:MAG TPA: CpaF family protein [Gemmataceae bacterium]|jgi:pilus assembly protein CpaF|nr:CpaF family protein [Gemmataceae bacterium]